MKLTDSEAALLNDLANSKDWWLRTALKAVTSQSPDLRWVSDESAWTKVRETLRTAGCEKEFGVVVNDLLSGLTHSFLVTLDGGTELAETTNLAVLDKDNHEFRKCLHEFWPEYDGNPI